MEESTEGLNVGVVHVLDVAVMIYRIMARIVACGFVVPNRSRCGLFAGLASDGVKGSNSYKYP